MILRKIKQLLGMGSADSDDGGSEQEVVMQDDSTGPATETEAAVKGVDDEGSGSDDSVGTGDVDEPVAAETDAAASTESLVDEEGTSEDPETRAEPAETTGAAEGEGEETAEEPDSPDVDTGDADAEDGVPVEEIKGIGPAYSERLEEVGIHNVAQLAAADPAELAERITVSEKTVGKWVDRAADHED